MNENAWLIYHWTGLDEMPSETIICTNKTEALEMFMAFVEEEMYITFTYMILGEDLDTDWVWLAQNLSYYDGTLWNVMEVPIIYGDSCGEELPKPARGKRALLGVW